MNLSTIKTKNILLLLFFISSIYNISTAQQNFTLYGLKETSQAYNLNPGFRQKNRVYISLPLGFQNIYLNHSGFTLNNLLQKGSNDSLYINPENAINKMARLNFINLESYNQILGFGFKFKKNNFISFNVANRLRTNFSYPQDLFKLISQGNGSSDFLGKRASLDGLAIDASSYIEYALGYNRNVNKKLTVGGRVKLLSGVANIHTTKSKLGLYTDPTTFDITIDGAMAVNTSNIYPFIDTNNSNNNFNIVPYLTNFKNLGLGLDLGGSYKLTDKINLSASVLDLGFITWKSNTKNYQSKEVNYTFKGVDFNKIFSDTTYNIGKDLQDTTSTIFSQENNTDKYRTSLHSKFYLGGSYAFTKWLNTSFTMSNEFNRTRYRAGIAIAANITLRNWLAASINYSMYGRAYNNIGFGLSLKGGPIQFFVMSDNVLAFINPANAKNVHISTGLNFIIGPLKDKDEDGIKDKRDHCPELPGEEKYKGCPDKDADGVIDTEDECPDLAGLIFLKGCPDKDKDSIADKDDDCPEIAGLRKFKGCPDKDNDSIIDSKDECPEIAGLIAFNGCPDTDGDGIKDSEDACPEVSGTLVNQGCPDSDNDGVLDAVDNCITVAGPKENNGCPWSDTDADGLLDKDDKCPYLAGPIKNQGCPYQDTDEDGILDDADKCPTVKGVLENNGCPKIEEAEKEILKTAFDNLEFNTGNAVIKETSFASLDDLASLLIKKKEWKLQISGHTDNVGNDQANLVLSKKRSEAVKLYLTSKGVDTARISALFFGETQPLTTNDTEDGRRKNRRVEMTVVFQ